jgi:DNA-binding transcriptional LysR family regulator
MAPIEPTVAPSATIDLNQIATLVRVVDSGSFTAAARALGVPKSSVSRAIAGLESKLGCTLLQRTTRTLTLTRSGERYLASAREALQTLDEARTELANDRSALRGSVRMTAPFDASTRLGMVLARAIATFVARYPEVFVDMLFTGRRVDLISEGVDFAIRAGKLDDSALIARRIKTDQLVLVAAPQYLEQHGTPRTFADLARHRVLLYNAPQGMSRLRMTSPQGSASVMVRGPINVDDMAFQLPLTEYGAGIAMMPLLLADDSLRAGRLVRVLPGYARKDAAIHLVYPAQRHTAKRVVLLRDHVYDTLVRELARCTAAS